MLTLIEHQIDAAVLTAMEKLLKQDHAVGNEDRDGVIWQTTVKIGDGYEIDYKVCNSDDGPYLDVVTFLNGHEIDVTTGDALAGEWEFPDRGVVIDVISA